jgi:2-iminobutanoate/2-iminopropanoate deaminase
MALPQEVVHSKRVPRIGPYSHLRAVLEDAGTGLHRAVKVTCFLADMDAFQKLNELFAEYFPESPPVRSAPVVALPRGLLFSVDAIAVVE